MARPKSPAARSSRPPSKPSSAGYAADSGATESSRVVMGEIVGSFGLKGWVKVKVFTEAADSLALFPTWMVHGKEGWRDMALEEFEVHSKGPVAKLAGCDDRDAADALRGAEVAVAREALGEAREGTMYWVDLVGLAVVDESGARLGEVEGLFEAGDTSVLVVKGARQRLIPFVPDYVKSVDREAGRIMVDWKPDYE